MKVKLIIRSVLFMISLATLLACDPVKKNTVSIRLGENSDSTLSGVKIFRMNLINYEEENILQPTKATDTVSFKILKPTFATLLWAGKRQVIFLEPGYDLKIELREGQLSFSGNGAHQNNYLVQATKLREQIEMRDSTNLLMLDPARFRERVEFLEQALADFHKQFSDSTNVSSKYVDVLGQWNRISVACIRQNYNFNYGTMNKFQIPDSMRVDDKVYADTLMLDYNMLDFAMLLNLKYIIEYVVKLPAPDTTHPMDRMPGETATSIEQAGYPPAIQEIMLAINVHYWMSAIGIPKHIEKIYRAFQEMYPSSRYTSTLQSRHDKWLALSPGKRAPVIRGKTPLGLLDSTTSLLGKIIYVDVWATWCGPCIAEFPHAKKLAERFSGTDRVVFVYVSVDRDVNAWREMVKERFSGSGWHINQSGDINPSIGESYMINGIPRYILIDQKGAVVESNAERPSSPKITAQIDSLLSIDSKK